jgi:DNA-binding transcriptional ArsR family regulator
MVKHPVRNVARPVAWIEMVIMPEGEEMTDMIDRHTEVSKLLKALSHPARLKLLATLMKRECCVGEIQNCLALSQPNVSQHLGILKRAGVISGTRERNKICYKISNERIKKILEILEIGEK